MNKKERVIRENAELGVFINIEDEEIDICKECKTQLVPNEKLDDLKVCDKCYDELYQDDEESEENA